MELTQSLLRELFDYDPVLGVLYFRKRAAKWFDSEHRCAMWNARFAGKVNGTTQSKGNGYRRIKVSVLGKQYLAHRIIWIYMTGERPPKQIDHVDRDATNNSWANLRDAKEVNQKNKSMQRNNRSGVTGVSWSKANRNWCARVWGCEGGKRVYKYLGGFASIEEAKRAVIAYRVKQGYSVSHGKNLAPYDSRAN